jgi:hypothetical protein
MDHHKSVLLPETSSALASTTVFETFGASASNKRFLKWEDSCTIMNSAKFTTTSYTFLMDYVKRPATDNNNRVLPANTMLFDGDTTTKCKADNKKYRWTVEN